MVRASGRWFPLYGFAALLALALAVPGASAQIFPDRLAVIDAQFSRAANDRARQVGLVHERLDNTRSERLAGHNANASSLALRFTNASSETGSKDQNAVFQTKNHIAAEKDRRTRRYAVWFGGDVTLDAQRASDPRMATVFSNGVAFGTDARVGPRLIVGNAVGAAFDQVGVGAEASQRSRYLSNTLYGSVFAAADTFLDLAAGASLADFASLYEERMASGQRRAGQVFGSARYSRDVRKGAFVFRPYGRAAVSYTVLDAYSEKGADALACAAQSGRMLDLGLGLRTEAALTTAAGRIRPHADIAMTRTVRHASAGTITSSADPGSHAAVAAARALSAGFAATTGIDWTIGKRATFGTLYGVTASRAAPEPRQTVSARFTLRF